MARRPVASALEPAQRPIYRTAAPSVAQFVELWREIPLVEHDRPAEQLERQRECEVATQPGPSETAVIPVAATDHGDPVSVSMQRGHLLLQPVVTGEGNVLYQQQDMLRPGPKR